MLSNMKKVLLIKIYNKVLLVYGKSIYIEELIYVWQIYGKYIGTSELFGHL